jgi:regulator of protease activity HflC (stomatin/prohibitin superfamily)
VKTNERARTAEIRVQTASGWPMLAMTLVIPIIVGVMIYFLIIWAHAAGKPNLYLLFSTIALGIAWLIGLNGFFTLQPNEACVLTLFGSYVGTERNSGFHYTNPFNSKSKLSLRSRNFNTPKLKVNDLRGNPIEIGAVVVWHIYNTAEALFDVNNYEEFVSVQSESAVRSLASRYPYDHGEEGEITLRCSVDEISLGLQQELQTRLASAGVFIEETRLIHLAYAPEIAHAMLRRQQAEAVIAARQKIVHGAVSMVEMALHDISEKKMIELDDERKAAMISNLLIVLCSESDTQPVINTGSLYS